MAGRFARRIYNSARWKRVRRMILERSGWRCERCGSAGALEVHHRVRLADGGDPWNPESLEAVCRTCHMRQSADESRGRPSAKAEQSADESAWDAYLASLAPENTNSTEVIQ